MPTTYEPIASTTVGSNTSSVTFSSIPSTYTDLKLIIVANDGDNGNGGVLSLQFNGDAGSNYSTIFRRGDGSTSSQGQFSSFPYAHLGSLSGASGFWSFYECDILSYRAAVGKRVLTKTQSDRDGNGIVDYNVSSWRNNTAITSLTIQSNNAPTRTLQVGTTISLYGILRA